MARGTGMNTLNTHEHTHIFKHKLTEPLDDFLFGYHFLDSIIGQFRKDAAMEKVQKQIKKLNLMIN